MKKFVFYFLMLISTFANVISYSQTQVYDVKTPMDSPVVAHTWSDYLSDEERAEIDSIFENHSVGWNLELIETYDGYSNTRRFNCHGYAWFMSEESSVLSKPRWIGVNSLTAEDIYMSDGSYVQVASEMYPGKVSWPSNDNHSAITTNQTGVYISKWGSNPLIRHDWDEQPYGTSGLKYYVSTSVSGSTSILCSSTRSFSAINIPNASYSWSTGLGLTLNSNGNYNTSVTVNGSYYGETWIRVEITSPIPGSDDVKLGPKLYFTTVGSNSINASNVIFTNCNSVTGSLCTNCDDNEFGLPSGEYEYAEVKLTNLAGTTTYDQFYCYSQSETVDWGQYAAGTYKFWVRGINDCGTSSWSSTNLSIVDCGRSSSYYLEFTPNPVMTETTVELKRYDEVEVAETIEWEYEVYDMSQMKKLKTYKFHGKKSKIKANGWKEGVYIVRAIVKDEMVSGKFIKK